MWLVKTDSGGNEQWHKRYDIDNFVSVVQADNSKYIVFGNSQLAAMDNSGNMLWTEFYNISDDFATPSPYSQSTRVTDGVITSDGSLIVVGNVNNPVNGDYYFWAAKFAPESNNPSEDSAVSSTTLIAIAVISVVITVAVLLIVIRKTKLRAKLTGKVGNQ